MIRDDTANARVLSVVIHATLVFVFLVTVVPVLHIAAYSLSSRAAQATGISVYPRDIDLSAYHIVFKAGTVMNAMFRSLLYASTGTAINVVVTGMMAFALSRSRLTFRNFYMIVAVIPMFFSGGLIPTFILVKQLGMVNTIFAMILPNAVLTWNLIILRTFFISIPVELDESAHIDGAHDITIFFRIIIPVAQAGVATIAIFYAVSHWNSWFNALIYLWKPEKYPLQLVLRNIVIEGEMEREFSTMGDMASLEQQFQRPTDEAIKYATICISIVPMLLLYPFVQRYFVRGIMIGSIKG